MNNLSALSILDILLVEKTQWVMRQVELFTPLSRETLISSFLKIFHFLILLGIPMLIFSFFEWLTDRSVNMLLPAILIFWWRYINFTYSLEEKIFNQQKSLHGELPKEIVERAEFRKTILRFYGIAFLLLPVFVFMFKKDYLFFIPSCILLLTGLTSGLGVTEYLLCTTSLPPGEKERRRTEKETKNLLPAGTS